MQIQAVISAVIIMILSSTLTSIPKPFYLLHVFWLFPIEVIKKFLLHRLAETPLSVHGNLQRLIDQVLLRRHDIGDIPKGPGIKRGRIHVHMNAAALIDKGSVLSKLTDQFLNDGDVLILTDGAYHLRFILFVGPYPLASALDFRLNASVTHKLPLPPFGVLDRIRFIKGSHIVCPCPKILRRRSGRILSRNPGQLNLDAEFLLLYFHPRPPSFIRLSYPPPASPIFSCPFLNARRPFRTAWPCSPELSPSGCTVHCRIYKGTRLFADSG